MTILRIVDLKTVDAQFRVIVSELRGLGFWAEYSGDKPPFQRRVRLSSYVSDDEAQGLSELVSRCRSEIERAAGPITAEWEINSGLRAQSRPRTRGMGAKLATIRRLG